MGSSAALSPSVSAAARASPSPSRSLPDAELPPAVVSSAPPQASAYVRADFRALHHSWSQKNGRLSTPYAGRVEAASGPSPRARGEGIVHGDRRRGLVAFRPDRVSGFAVDRVVSHFQGRLIHSQRHDERDDLEDDVSRDRVEDDDE